MAEVVVVTDSCASIPAEMLHSLRIEWVPYYIHRGKEVLRDLVTARADEFYSWMRSATTLPTTAAPGPGDYLTMYEKLADRGVREIISVHMTSKGSAAYQAACSAKDMLIDRVPSLTIDVVDTLNVAMCHGWIVIEAARAAIRGLDRAEIMKRINAMIPRTRMIQTADTLRYLQMGGRIGKATQLLGSLLNIKPLIGMQDGIIVAVGKARSRERAYAEIARRVREAVGDLGKIKAAFVHVAALDEAQRLDEIVAREVNCEEKVIAELSPALGVHSGPGTAGICYLEWPLW